MIFARGFVGAEVKVVHFEKNAIQFVRGLGMKRSRFCLKKKANCRYNVYFPQATIVYAFIL